VQGAGIHDVHISRPQNNASGKRDGPFDRLQLAISQLHEVTSTAERNYRDGQVPIGCPEKSSEASSILDSCRETTVAGRFKGFT
jgi:hypothetical protein